MKHFVAQLAIKINQQFFLKAENTPDITNM